MGNAGDKLTVITFCFNETMIDIVEITTFDFDPVVAQETAQSNCCHQRNQLGLVQVVPKGEAPK